MDERDALALVGDAVPSAGDDAAVVGTTVVTTDMLHETTDFPDGTTRYTAGWRAVGASLSDVAAMGADATAAVAVYAAPTFEPDPLAAFLDGANEVCERVDATYAGGDLDTHAEFTVATTALGETSDPVGRDGAAVGDRICVTGALGRSAAGLRYFEQGDPGQGNELFRFTPRVAAGQALAPYATAMMDSSDGLARSVHQLAAASDFGMAIEGDAVPVADAVEAVADGDADRRELSMFFGEDFELVCTVPADDVATAQRECPVSLSVVGEVTATGVTLDGDALPDRGYTHG